MDNLRYRKVVPLLHNRLDFASFKCSVYRAAKLHTRCSYLTDHKPGTFFHGQRRLPTIYSFCLVLLASRVGVRIISPFKIGNGQIIATPVVKINPSTWVPSRNDLVCRQNSRKDFLKTGAVKLFERTAFDETVACITGPKLTALLAKLASS